MSFRIGHGYDSHRFDLSRPLFLGGILIPNSPGLAGHSDADVLLHAVIDALLGAAALGDIGSHFPDSDPKWLGANSATLLTSVASKVAAAGFSIANIDATLICEKPRLRPHVDAIRSNIASILNLPISHISVKGKTNEKMDDVGASVGIIAHCVTLLEFP